MKDRFSSVAKAYAQFRPQYPAELYDFLLSHCTNKKGAWDAGTGNGQVARELSKHFKQVFATDISETQLHHAETSPNITYSVQPAETTIFSNQQFDLITVAQAIHWFDLKMFFAEANRVLKPGGILAAWGYGLIETEGALNDILHSFYHSLDKYWDGERSHIDDAYANIPFPYPLISSPVFTITVHWNIDQLIGFLSTWSAVKNYISQHSIDPIKELSIQVNKKWGALPILLFRFPIFMKAGKK